MRRSLVLLIGALLLLSCVRVPAPPESASHTPPPVAASVPTGGGSSSAPVKEHAELQGGSYVRETYFGEGGGEKVANEVIGKGKKILLFFYAGWCPYCQHKDALLKELYGRASFPLSTYRLDYDTTADLKARFGVTTQDTVVLLDGSGNPLQMVVGATEQDLRVLLSSS